MDNLGPLARRDFIILEAAWTLGESLELLMSSGMQAAVIHRVKDDHEYFYVFLRSELQQAAQHFPPEAPLRAALDLHEWGADKEVDESAPADSAPSFSVVVSDRVVTGYTHPGAQDATVRSPEVSPL